MDMVNSPLSENKTWFQDGIIYTEFTHSLTYESIHAMQDRAMELIAENGVEHAPYIIILSGDARGKMHYNLADMGKIVSHELTKHVADVWVVGRTESHSRTADTMNHFFFADRIHFMDSVEEATAGAGQSIADGRSVLERGTD